MNRLTRYINKIIKSNKINLILAIYLLASFSLLFALQKKADHIVLLTDIEFKPNRLKVKVGETIKFINKDKFDHDVYIVRTANPNDVIFPATTIHPGQSIIVKINETGLFSLFCTIHGGMTGKITTTGSFELTEAEKKLAQSKKILPPIVKTGKALFWGKAQCYQCHKIGQKGKGLRGPDLRDIGFRANIRAQKLGLSSGTEYLIQSIAKPDAYIVPGYTNDMALVYQPPINLNVEEIKAIIAYLQSQGGEVDTWAIDIDKDMLPPPPKYNPFQIGNAQKGAVLFKEAGCVSCHTVGTHKSTSAGPDLSEIGAYRDWRWLSQSILDPNAEIGVNWRYATLVVKTKGRGFRRKKTVMGFIRKNTTREVKLLVAPGVIKTFPKSQIEKIILSKTSKMPSNYSEIMTFKQIADLVSYLQSLKRKGSGTNNKKR